MEQLAKAKLNGTQRAILDVIFRYTYGFNRIEHEFGLTFLAKATGRNKMQVKRELDKLIERKIILVVENSDYNNPKVLKFNKDYDQWIQLAKTLTVNEKAKSTVSENAYSTVSELAYSTVSENAYQEIKNKKNIKEKYKEKYIVEKIPYAEIVNYLNQRIGSQYKHTTKKTRALIKARWNEGFRLEDFQTVIDKKANEWIGTDMQKYLRPETLFGNKFEGYLNQPNRTGTKQAKRIPKAFASLNDYEFDGGIF